LLTIATQLKSAWPDKLLGASYATLGPVKALQRSVRSGLDATWTVRTDVTARMASRDAVEAATSLKSRPAHRFFAAIAFCARDVEAEPGLAAIRARELGMIPTTGGDRIGGSSRKLETIRDAIGNAPLALAGNFAAGQLGSLWGFDQVSHGCCSFVSGRPGPSLGSCEWACVPAVAVSSARTIARRAITSLNALSPWLRAPRSSTSAAALKWAAIGGLPASTASASSTRQGVDFHPEVTHLAR